MIVRLFERHFRLINTFVSLYLVISITMGILWNWPRESIFSDLGLLAMNIVAGFLYPYAVTYRESHGPPRWFQQMLYFEPNEREAARRALPGWVRSTYLSVFLVVAMGVPIALAVYPLKSFVLLVQVLVTFAWLTLVTPPLIYVETRILRAYSGQPMGDLASHPKTELRHVPRWVPYALTACLGSGIVLVFFTYMVWGGSMFVLLLALGLIGAGMAIAATQWE